MLSLFSSVGICRILRYGSSNTSAVEQQVCPRFFPDQASKFGEMRRCERKMLKCNAELVDPGAGQFRTSCAPCVGAVG